MAVEEVLVNGSGQFAGTQVQAEDVKPKAKKVAAPAEPPPESAPVVEAPLKKEELKDEPKDPKFGQRFAELSKRQRALLEKEKELKEREERLAPVVSARDEKDYRKRLEAIGLTYEELTDFILKDGEEDEPLTEEERIEAVVEKKLTAKEQREKEAKDSEEAERTAKQAKEQEEALQAAIETRKKVLAETVEANQDKYELTFTMRQTDLAWDVTEAWWNEHQEMLSPEQALEKVEAYLEEEAGKILKAKKFQKAPEVPQEPEATRERAPAKATTLSNRIQTSQSPVAERPHFSREESKRRAAAMLKFNK